MSIPLPRQITGSGQEQLRQIQSYLFRLSQELELALGTVDKQLLTCLLYTSPRPRDKRHSRMPGAA